jgi:hypothetical protein
LTSDLISLTNEYLNKIYIFTSIVSDPFLMGYLPPNHLYLLPFIGPFSLCHHLHSLWCFGYDCFQLILNLKVMIKEHLIGSTL